MNYKNMKIEINESQPLDDVVMELERLGYKKVGWVGYKSVMFITANTKGMFTDHAISFINCFDHLGLTTLAELKAMTND